MAARFVNMALAALLVSCFIGPGVAEYDYKDLEVTTVSTGKLEYQVTVKNTSPCTQGNIKVNCTGFLPSVKVDPPVLTKVDPQTCLLNNGDYIYVDRNLTFLYTWDKQFSFTPVDSSIACS